MKYYELEDEKLYKELNTNKAGLSNKEVVKRINQYGRNELPKQKKDSFFKIFFLQFKDPILLILILAACFSFIAGEYVECIAIFLILLLDISMGAFQEWKALKTAESLANLIKVEVEVIRQGREMIIDSVDLVPGDIVLLESGNKISADMRLINTHNLTVDESVLTGESNAVVKISKKLTGDITLAEQKNMVFAGTTVVTGRASAIVVKTGINTEIGLIADKVHNTEEAKSPLTIRMEKLSKQITLLVVVIAIIITILLFVKNVPGKEIFVSVIALSVSAMPEGLPLALTMALTVASNRMSKHNVIVKKLNAVEALGSCTVIASDKTGTLTLNEQTAKKIILPCGSQIEVTGTGYNDGGKVNYNKKNKEQVQELIKLGYINNEAILEKKGNNFQQIGDSIDVAFLALGQKANISIEDINKLEEIPYESENKYSATFFERNKKKYCTTKGSLEKILEFSNTMMVEGKEVKIDKDSLIKQNDKLASEGYRVIALASKEIKNFKEKDYYDHKDIPKLCFLGLVCFIDPIREDAKSSVDECKKAGIKVIMITGDHPLTAFAISKKLGITSKYEQVATGDQVSGYLEKGKEEFDAFVKDRTVFARVTPIEKLEIVESLKRQGEFVAVTGDGVNDAPAIKAANIGVAMGSGTDVAKETADMIIIDDSFKSIVIGVKEGRIAYSNIRKISYLLLSCGLAEVLFFILAIAFNMPMPLVAIQLLWLNVVTDGLQDFALSFEKAEDSIMQEGVANSSESIFNKTLLTEVLIAGLSMGLIVFMTWSFLLSKKVDVNTSRAYIMTLMVFMQNIHVLNCRSEKKSTFSVSLFKNKWIPIAMVGAIVLQIIVMEVETFAAVFKTSGIPILHIIGLFLLALPILIIMEVYKAVKYNNRNNES